MSIVLAGMGLMLLAGDPDEDEEEGSFAADDEEDKDRGLCMGLLGLGVMAAGGGLYHLLGGDSDNLTGHKVLVYFDEPTGANEGIETDVRRERDHP